MNSPIKLKIKKLWLETCLWLRVLWAAIKPKNEITPVGRLYIRVLRNDGQIEDHGMVSTKVVTDAGVNYLVQAFQNLAEPELFRFAASGTGITAEAASQTALVTEVATRVSGTLAQGASPNIFQTVATIPYVATLAITEHGIFSASAAGTMLDRSLFAAINVISGDSIQFTYELTLPSGS